MRALVGGACVQITPPLTIPYLGYVPRQSYFAGVHDQLCARALVFQDSTDAACILSADAIGFGNRILGPGRHFTDELRQRIQTRCGLESHRLMIASTHAHSTPETLGITDLLSVPAAGPWLETLLDQLTSAVSMAVENMASCTLKVGIGNVQGLAHNRRPGCSELSLDEQVEAGRLDPQLTVLVCEDEDGLPRYVVANTQCHPVAVQVQPLVSADFPGVATRLVEQTLEGCLMCTYLQGAAGNLNPIRDHTGRFRDVQLYGAIVAGETIKIAAGMLGDDAAIVEQGGIAVDSSRISLPARTFPERSEWEDRLSEAQRRELDAVGPEEKHACARQTQQLLEALDLFSRFSDEQEAEVQAVRLGNCAIVGVPGELFTEWGLKIKRESPAAHTLVSELTNGWVGYLLSNGSTDEGGYEASWGTWTQTTEEGAAHLVAELLRVLNGLWAG